MKAYLSRRLRPLLGTVLIFVSILAAGWLLYREWLAPLPPAHIAGIVDNRPLKTSPPTNESRRQYTVPPDHPKRLIIPKLAINANIYPMSLTQDGAIDAPKTAWGVGWYSGSSLPGNPGVMFIDGHVNDSFNSPGVFYELHKLEAGDTIQIERGDGKLFSYQVVLLEQVPQDKVDMQRLLRPVSHKPGLNLITCGGKYDAKNKTYSERIIIFAEHEE